MKRLTLTLLCFLSLAPTAFAEDTPLVIQQPIMVLKRPQLPNNPDVKVLFESEPSRYGKFLVKDHDDQSANIDDYYGLKLFFNHTNSQKKGHSDIQLDIHADWQSPITEVGPVEFPFITPFGEEFHLFQIVWAGSGGASTVYYVVVIDKERAWSQELSVPFAFDLKRESEVGIEEAHISQQQGKTILSLIAPPTTVSEGVTFLISMGSIETKRIEPLPRWAKSTRTFKMVGTFEAETDGARDHLPCISGKETSMDEGVKAPSGDQEYCVHKMGACQIPDTSEEGLYEGVPAEMTLLETVWSDGEREYGCLYLKGL